MPFKRKILCWIWVCLGIFIITANIANATTNDFPAYAGSASCQDCHHAEYNLWIHSHHALAERPLQPNVDKTAFSPARTVNSGSQNNTVRIQDGQFQIISLGFQTNATPYEVKRVIGADPVEQFITPSDGGRWQVQQISYNPNSHQWFDVYAGENRRPGEWGHWTGRGMNWNSECAECHNTDLKKNYNAVDDSYHKFAR